MLLISVDASYGRDLADAKKRGRAIFRRNKVDWPNVWEPDGWSGVMRRFNLGGYGLTLVDADGIVRGIDIRERDLTKLLKQLYPAVASSPARDGRSRRADAGAR